MDETADAMLVSAGYDHTIRFWNIVNGCCIRTLQHTESQVNALAISPDHHLIAAAGYQHIRIYDAQQGSTNAQPIVNYEGFSKNVTSIGFNKDMRWMYTGSEDFSARIWDLRTRTLDCQRIYQVNTPVNSVCLHPNQAELFIGDQSGTVHLWDMRNDHNEQIIPEPGYSINHVDVDQDATMLAAVNSNGVCFLWNMVSSALPDESTRLNPKIKVQKELHNRYALKCRFSPDATLLATTSADQTCRVWRTADFSECATLKVPGQRWVWDCAFTADSQYIFTCSSDNAVRLWKAEDGGPSIRPQAPLPGVGKTSAAATPMVNASSAAVKLENGKNSPAQIVEWASKPLREYLGHQRSVTCIALADRPIF